MDLHNPIAQVASIVALLGAIYKLAIEPNINAKIASLETKGFLVIDNLKDKLNERVTTTDRKVDIHLQDYTNYKDANLLQSNGLDEKINHTWNKTKELIEREKTDRKETQLFFQKQYEALAQQKQYDSKNHE
ncbi:MAG: hypothetical protein V7L04_31720 [Nostoc sp.]|uniref:hypothetical protein n=1 Tax=Nostoc sp. TaxID=1180 RepID=UPI002FF8DF52